jgi:hypothetical protein
MKLRIACRSAAALLLGCLLAASASGSGAFRLPDFDGDAWQPLHFPKIDKHTRYEPIDVDGRSALRATSACSASALIAPVEGLDLSRTPRLTWRWKVDRPIGARLSERQKGGDDFAARVYVAFRFDRSTASTWQLLKRRAAEGIYGSELPGNTLSYVWSQSEPAGRSWSNPYTAEAQMLSRGSGPLPDWRQERVNLERDYRSSFGAEPPPILFVGIMSDSDDSCSAASAWFADFGFEADGQGMSE